MKRFMFLAVILVIALSVPACAVTDYIYGCRVAGDKDATIDYGPNFTYTGVMGSSGAVSTAPGAIDAYGLYISSYKTVVGTRTGTYFTSLPATGFYTVSTTFGNVNQATAKTNAWFKVTNAGGVADVYQDQTNPYLKNAWASLGTFQFNAGDAANTRVMLTNDNQSTSGSLYLQSIKWSAATPGAVTGGTLIDTELMWTAGAFTSFFDVWFGTSAETLEKVATLEEGSTSMGLDLEALTPGNYFWRVDSLNVDKSTTGEVYSFSIEAVPEPGSMLALGTGLVGLLGFIRRKRS